MPVFIWVRRTVDWADEEAFRAQLAPELRPLVELWDATFSMPYHAFRHALRAIARDNHAQVQGARCAEWDEIPDEALVLPVDDDDWFAPDAALAAAEAHAAGGDGVRWRGAFLQVDIDARHTFSRVWRRLLPGAGAKWVCATNNYALVKRAGRRPLLESHIAASRAVTGAEIAVPFLDRSLSLMNRSLASQTSLRPHGRPIDRATLLRKRARYRRRYDRVGQEWARPYAERMRELMAALDVVR